MTTIANCSSIATRGHGVAGVFCVPSPVRALGDASRCGCCASHEQLSTYCMSLTMMCVALAMLFRAPCEILAKSLFQRLTLAGPGYWGRVLTGQGRTSLAQQARRSHEQGQGTPGYRS